MTRRTWLASLAAMLPFAGRFQGPVALGSLKVGERFRFANDTASEIATVTQRLGEFPKYSAAVAWRVFESGVGIAHPQFLVYRVR